MHHRVMGPPAVSYTAQRTALLGFVLFTLWLTGALLAAAALVAGGARWPVTHFALLLAFLALATFGLAAFWRAQRERTLRWDGRQWMFDDPQVKSSPTPLRRVEIRLDVQAVLLLRCVGPGAEAATWIWAERGREPARWHLLRCALYQALSAETDSQFEGGVSAA